MNTVTLALWDAHIRAQHHLDPFTPIYFRPGAPVPAPAPPARWRRWLHYAGSLLFAARLVGWRAGQDIHATCVYASLVLYDYGQRIQQQRAFRILMRLLQPFNARDNF